MAMDSILDRVRAEGFSAGLSQARQNYADMSTAERDDEFYKGQCDAWADAPSRFRWWLFGLICGLLPTFWRIVI